MKQSNVYKTDIIRIARGALLGVNNKLSVNDLELNFFDNDKIISFWFYFHCFGPVNDHPCCFYSCTLVLEKLLRIHQVSPAMLDLVVLIPARNHE